MKLLTSLADYEHIHKLADRTRIRNVEVPKKLLMNLLIDHGAMSSKLNIQGPTANDGSDLA